MEERQKGLAVRLLGPFTEMFGLSRGVAAVVLAFVVLVVVLAMFWFFHSAPPKTLSMTSGSPGSALASSALKYKAILARNGVALKVIPSQGALQNLERLRDSSFPVDIGFIQSGLTNTNGLPSTTGIRVRGLVSLGSISTQPLIIIYRSTGAVTLLSEFRGKRLAVGPAGSGTHSLAVELLKLNGIEPGGETVFTDLDADEAAQALLQGRVDAVFLMGDSASPQLIKELLQTPGVRIFDVTQADGYTRRLSYLNKLELPKGAIDFGKNIPSQDISLIGPTVELAARANLHPALIDLLIEAAQEVHGNAGLFKKKGEFPAPIEHAMPISPEATRYYKSGKSFLYRYLPFWLASVVNRVIVAFVPALVVLIPVLRMLPTLLRLRIRLQTYRWYRGLLALDRELRQSDRSTNKTDREELLNRLRVIERGVNRMKVPASFADQFYELRMHINFIREQLSKIA